MTPVFPQLVDAVLGEEGGYVNDPADPGGETNWGITVGVARDSGYLGPMKSMTRDTAVGIYMMVYWAAPRFDRVANIAPQVAAELFDTGINMGVVTAGGFLQRVLNVLDGSATPGLTLDGSVGPATLKVLQTLIFARGALGDTVVAKAMNCLQGARYIELAEARPTSERFVFGWLANRVKLNEKRTAV